MHSHLCPGSVLLGVRHRLPASLNESQVVMRLSNDEGDGEGGKPGGGERTEGSGEREEKGGERVREEGERERERGREGESK